MRRRWWRGVKEEDDVGFHQLRCIEQRGKKTMTMIQWTFTNVQNVTTFTKELQRKWVKCLYSLNWPSINHILTSNVRRVPFADIRDDLQMLVALFINSTYIFTAKGNEKCINIVYKIAENYQKYRWDRWCSNSLRSWLKTFLSSKSRLTDLQILALRRLNQWPKTISNKRAFSSLTLPLDRGRQIYKSMKISLGKPDAIGCSLEFLLRLLQSFVDNGFCAKAGNFSHHLVFEQLW